MVSTTTTIEDSPPTIAHLTATPANPAAGLPVTLRAVGVADPFNTVSTVNIYWNPTGASTLTGAVLLGSTTAKKGWALTITLNSATASLNPFPTTGTATFLAVAVDASGTNSTAPTVLTTNVNTPPSISTLSPSATSVYRTHTLTLTATDVIDPNDKFRVAFYRGAIGDSTLNTSTDALLGYGTLIKSTNNYALTIKIPAGMAVGAYPFFAVAINGHGASSNVVTATVTILDDPPAIAKLVVATAHVAADNPVTLVAAGVTDADGTVSSVSFYWVFNGTNELLGTATGKQGWTLKTTLPSATDPTTPFPASGPVVFEAQAIDNLGTLGSVASATVVNVVTQPAIGLLTVTPTTINHLDTTTPTVLTAGEISNGPIVEVQFWFAAAPATAADTATDTLLGLGVKEPGGDWVLTLFNNHSKLAVGNDVVFARAAG